MRTDDANGCKGLSLDDFGDKGLETKARLEALSSDSEKKCGWSVVEALVTKQGLERRSSGKSTSGGEVGRSTVCTRQKTTRKVRLLYGNLCANLHCECGCGTTNVREDGSAPAGGEGGGFMQEAMSVSAAGVTAGSSETAKSQSKGTTWIVGPKRGLPPLGRLLSEFWRRWIRQCCGNSLWPEHK